jgi:hypothetical protein
MSWLCGSHDTYSIVASHADTNVAGTKKKRSTHAITKYMTIKSSLTTFHHPPDPVPQPPSFWMSAGRLFIPTGSVCPNPAEGGAFL